MNPLEITTDTQLLWHFRFYIENIRYLSVLIEVIYQQPWLCVEDQSLLQFKFMQCCTTWHQMIFKYCALIGCQVSLIMHYLFSIGNTLGIDQSSVSRSIHNVVGALSSRIGDFVIYSIDTNEIHGSSMNSTTPLNSLESSAVSIAPTYVLCLLLMKSMPMWIGKVTIRWTFKWCVTTLERSPIFQNGG